MTTPNAPWTLYLAPGTCAQAVHNSADLVHVTRLGVLRLLGELHFDAVTANELDAEHVLAAAKYAIAIADKDDRP